MVEVTDIGGLTGGGDRMAASEDLPEVARRSLEGSSPSRTPRAKKPEEAPSVLAAAAGVPGSHRVHILVAGGGRVKETVSEDLGDVARAIDHAGEHEVWVDIEADDAEKALAPFEAKVSADQYVVQNQDKRSVIGWPYIVRDQAEPRFC